MLADWLGSRRQSIELLGGCALKECAALIYYRWRTGSNARRTQAFFNSDAGSLSLCIARATSTSLAQMREQSSRKGTKVLGLYWAHCVRACSHEDLLCTDT